MKILTSKVLFVIFTAVLAQSSLAFTENGSRGGGGVMNFEDFAHAVTGSGSAPASSGAAPNTSGSAPATSGSAPASSGSAPASSGSTTSPTPVIVTTTVEQKAAIDKTVSTTVRTNGVNSLSKHLDRVGGFSNVAPQQGPAPQSSPGSSSQGGGATSGDNNQQFASQFLELEQPLNTYESRKKERQLLLSSFLRDSSIPSSISSDDVISNAAQEEVLNRPVKSTILSNSARWSSWVDTNYTVVDNSLVNSTDDQRFDGDIITVSSGLDYWVNKKLLVGTYVSYSDVALDTTFNDGTYDEKSLGIAPYILYKLTDNLQLNGSVGYYYGDIDQKQDITSSVVSSSTKANTVFSSIELKHKYKVENSPLQVVTSFGYSHSRRVVDSFVDSAATLNAKQVSKSSQFNLGAEFRYAIKTNDYSYQPFIKLNLIREDEDAVNDDPDSGVVSVGVRFYHLKKELVGQLVGRALLVSRIMNSMGSMRLSVNHLLRLCSEVGT